ncbi:hypothetical protein HMPREF1609_03889 [Escherichia coli 908541]|nr:hypothetical protein HMPREF1609_03889 [Escherichia coli 908541]
MLSVINGKVFLFSVFALFVKFSEFAFCWLYLMCITICVLFSVKRKSVKMHLDDLLCCKFNLP